MTFHRIPTHFPEMDPDEWMEQLDEVRAKLVSLRVAALKKGLRTTGQKLVDAGGFLDEARRDMQLHAIERDVEG